MNILPGLRSQNYLFRLRLLKSFGFGDSSDFSLAGTCLHSFSIKMLSFMILKKEYWFRALAWSCSRWIMIKSTTFVRPGAATCKYRLLGGSGSAKCILLWRAKILSFLFQLSHHTTFRRRTFLSNLFFLINFFKYWTFKRWKRYLFKKLKSVHLWKY